MESIKKRANESAHKYYDCKSCEWRCECKMDKGSNTPFECCDCAADDYMIGYAEGATEQRDIDLKEFADRLTEMQGEYITLDLIDDLVEAMKLNYHYFNDEKD